jgi:hypothetical protein
VYVKHFLPGGFAIGQPQVDAFTGHTFYAAMPHGPGDHLRDTEHTPAIVSAHLDQIGGMGAWHDQHMALIQGANIHERGDTIIFVDHTGRQPAL